MKIEFDLKRYRDLLNKELEVADHAPEPNEKPENYPVIAQIYRAILFNKKLQKEVLANYYNSLFDPCESVAVFMAVGYRMAQEDAKKNA